MSASSEDCTIAAGGAPAREVERLGFKAGLNRVPEAGNDQVLAASDRPSMPAGDDAGPAEGDCAIAAAPGAMRIEDVLASEGLYVGTPVGVSMRPMLRQRQDTIVVSPPAGPLRPGDVALYRRGEAYVLHRVVRPEPGGYTILGDNCLAYEHVPSERVIGVLTGFYRGEREVDMDGAGYRAYVAAWRALTPLRRAALRARGVLARGPVGDVYRALRGRRA